MIANENENSNPNLNELKEISLEGSSDKRNFWNEEQISNESKLLPYQQVNVKKNKVNEILEKDKLQINTNFSDDLKPKKSSAKRSNKFKARRKIKSLKCEYCTNKYTCKHILLLHKKHRHFDLLSHKLVTSYHSLSDNMKVF